MLGGLPALVPGDVARLDDVGIGGTGLAFALVLSVVVGLAFGAAPAFQWSRFSLVRALNEGSAPSAGGFRLLNSNRARAALAAAQVALSIVLLVGAGLLLRSFVGLVTVDRGFDPANVITARTGNPDAPRDSGVPGPEGGAGAADAIRLRLLGGRLFTTVDRAGGPGVVVVNETLARHVSGDGEAVGQRVQFGGADDRWWDVIGVVTDLQYAGLAVSEQQAEAFVPADQAEAVRPVGTDAFVTVRTTGNPLALIPFIREAVVEAHPRATIEDVMTMDGRLSLAVAQPRFYAFLVGFFAALALLLAASGIYGLLSYTVAQRRGEIGIRMALGARRGDILGLVVRQGAMLVAAGAIVGLGAAAASSRVLESFPLRCDHGRSPDLRRGAARAGRRGARRLLATGAPGDPRRSDGGPSRRVASAA